MIPNITPFPGLAVEAAPIYDVGTVVKIPGTNVELTYTKYSANTSVATVAGDWMCEESTQSGDKNALSTTMKAACTDGSRVSKTNFVGVALNSSSASTGGFGWTMTGDLALLNDFFGTSITAKLTTSSAAGTLLKTSTGDHKALGVSTGDDIATAIGRVLIAPSSTNSTENVRVFKRYGN